MTKSERKRYDEYVYYLKKQYPHCKPCESCMYWAGSNGETHYKSCAPHCDYLEMTGEVRRCTPDLKHGSCESYEQKRSKKRKAK